MTDISAELTDPQLEALVEGGDSDAALKLSSRYEFRKDTPDYEAALAWLNKAAEMKNTAAFARLASLYHRGEKRFGIEIDKTIALKYYEAAAEGNDPNALYWLALAIDSIGKAEQPADNKKRVIPLLAAADAAGYVKAKTGLAKVYLQDATVPRNTIEAFRLLKDFTDIARAEYETNGAFMKIDHDVVLYPLCLALGVGCAKDVRRAYDVMEDLAQKGYFTAMEILEQGCTPKMRIYPFLLEVTAATPPFGVLDITALVAMRDESRSGGYFVPYPQTDRAQKGDEFGYLQALLREEKEKKAANS